MILNGRDYVKIQEAARILGVTEQTLRNWDRRGKLATQRHPVNGYRIYRVAEIHELLRTASSEQVSFEFDTASRTRPDLPDLPPCHWSPEVALDPKHRPQHWDRTSSTVRRDWRKFPQEAHVIDRTGTRYRRLTVDEIAVLQGFDPSVARLDGLTERERIAALGDSVPPPLAKAVVSSICEVWKCRNRTAIEICAGIGGLAEGASTVGLDHALLVDHWEVSGRLLRNGRHWRPDRVQVGDAREIAWSAYADKVGLLSGGPPCQPWSQSGNRLGHSDERDLLGRINEVVAAVRPEVFLFENVPGLGSGSQNGEYLRQLVLRLRRPAEGLRYGVLVAQFNAADFGVPQNRERLFILGLRDSPASLAARCFDLVERKKTHKRLGSRNGPSRPSWVTVGEAISTMPDPGGWRRWIGV